MVAQWGSVWSWKVVAHSEASIIILYLTIPARERVKVISERFDWRWLSNKMENAPTESR
jgi:hypothetical protein